MLEKLITIWMRKFQVVLWLYTILEHWDEVTKKFIEKDDSSATSFVETEAEEMKSVLGEVIDLSGETGVIGYTITDE